MADASVDDQTTASEVGDGEAPPKRRFSGKKIVMFLGLPVLLILGATQTGILDGLMGGDEPAQEEDKAHEDPAAEAIYFDLPDMLVNLNTGGKGKPRYLKLSVSLEVTTEAAVLQLEKMLPRIIDRFQVYLRELRAEDVSGSAGVYRLKEELLDRVSGAVDAHEIRDVLFREMLVQ